MSITLVLGAGASRGVSYARASDIPSPLDRDFFDLLQRLRPQEKDEPFVQSTLLWVKRLPREYWRSMERAFYTLHLRSYISGKLNAPLPGQSAPQSDADVVHAFVNATGALLRSAHRKKTCEFHVKLLERLGTEDAIVSFNYDLVPERALKALSQLNAVPFGGWLYGFEPQPLEWTGPTIAKMHGSFNWEMRAKKEKNAFPVRTSSWNDLEETPGVLRYLQSGTDYPIFLPFWDKRIELNPWIYIWRMGFEKLKAADSVIVWGYSLPASDVKASLVFQLALGRRELNLCVIDPSVSTRDRWRALCPNAKFWEFDYIEEFFAVNPHWWRERG